MLRCAPDSAPSPSPRGVRWLPGLALLVGLSALAAAAPRPVDPAEILKNADVASFSPASFRARLRITAGQSPRRSASDVEIFVAGETRSLVRFLDPGEAGKFLLRQGKELWFLSPKAKPVKLAPAWRLRGGASLDDLLGLRWSRDYRVDAHAEEKDGGEIVHRLDLAALAPGMPYPKIRLFVARGTGLPLRAEYRLPSGKVASVAEFVAWSDPAKRRIGKLVLKDPLRPLAPTDIEFLETEPRSLPDGLFSLDSGEERGKLPPPAPMGK